MNPHQLNTVSIAHRSAARNVLLTALALALIATLALAPVHPAQAQGLNALEEVIVTARKREETLQEVPVVVNVLTDNMITSQRIESIRDISTIVPGMVASKAISGTSGMIYLRGVGTGSGNPAFDQAVAINIDGMGINSAQLMNAGMFDLKQIEVLKGPQALFFGKNSPGGVIAIHTKDPGDEFEFQITGAYETVAEEKTIQAIISGPLSDTFGARLALGYSDADDSWISVFNEDRFETGPFGPVQTAFETGNPTMETSFILGTLLWEPTDNFSASLKYAHLEDELRGASYGEIQKIWCPSGDFQGVTYPIAGVPCKADDKAITPGVSPLLNAGLFEGQYANDTEGRFDNENNLAVLELNYDLNDALTLTSVTGYFDNEELRLSDSSFQNAVGLPAVFVTELDQWSQELRLVSSYNRPVNFSLDAFYEQKDIARDSEVAAGVLALVPVVGTLFPLSIGRQVREQEGTAWSVFAQINWDVTEQWTLAFGGRYSYEEKEVVSAIEIKDPNVYSIPALPRTAVPLAEPKKDWNNFSPELTVSYQLNDDVMFFASYREGFKSGGYDISYGITPRLFAISGASGPLDLSYNEETVDGFEVGMKSTLLDGSLRFNITAYSYAYEELQLSKFDGDTLSFSIFNAGKASVDGLEVETFWSTPLEGLTLTANIAWANSEFDEFLSPCWAGQTIAMGCDSSAFDPDEGAVVPKINMAGENLPYASDLSATLGASYDMAVSDGWNLAMNFNASFKDDYNPSSQKIPEAGYQDSYWWLNAGLTLYSSDNKWEVYFRGVNLTDEIYLNTGGPTPGQGDDTFTGTNDPSGLPDWISYVQGGQQLNFGFTYRM